MAGMCTLARFILRHELYDRNYGDFLKTDDRFRRIIPGNSISIISNIGRKCFLSFY